MTYYFETSLHKFSLNQIYMWYDFPRILTVIDDNSLNNLVYWIGDQEGESLYLIRPVSPSEIEDYENKVMCLRELLDNASKGMYYVLHEVHDEGSLDYIESFSDYKEIKWPNFGLYHEKEF